MLNFRPSAVDVMFVSFWTILVPGSKVVLRRFLDCIDREPESPHIHLVGESLLAWVADAVDSKRRSRARANQPGFSACSRSRGFEKESEATTDIDPIEPYLSPCDGDMVQGKATLPAPRSNAPSATKCRGRKSAAKSPTISFRRRPLSGAGIRRAISEGGSIPSRKRSAPEFFSDTDQDLT